LLHDGQPAFGTTTLPSGHLRSATDWAGPGTRRGAVRGRHGEQSDRGCPRRVGVRRTALPGGGLTVSSGGALNPPRGMTLAPNGDILTVIGGYGNSVGTTV